jgi:hypothetical protein
MMLGLLALLAVAYVVLKVLNTRAKFEEADRERERLAAEEAEAEFDEMKESAVDVETEDEIKTVETGAEEVVSDAE